ncbi:MAG: isoprenyl transferase [Prevotella sp.]|jgi:undecaprenyl diphosphate synthase|nr:isoprenyl transferase [Prevotella sp.]MBR4379072.1 isoprenyl transferase [Prevotella sp.]
MIDKNNIPQHIAIIMDGNGRWAKERGQVRTAGHVEGVAALQRITADCCRLGVKYLTLYAFSTENWNRPDDEVAALMGLVLTHLTEELFDKNHVRMRVIGDRSRLPQAVREKLEWIENRTASYDVMTVTLAISYSSRWEITDAVKQIAEEVKEGKIAPDAITEETVSQHLNSSFQPDPDLLIRTGGELRISNYLLWQIAYSELYFTPVYWPDFNNDELLKAVEYYQTKQRRFGKTGDQVEEEESK